MPKHARSTPTPPLIELSDSDSGKAKSKVASTSTRRVTRSRTLVSPKSKPAKKWQTKLVDFAALNNPKPSSGIPSTRKLGKSKSMTTSTMTQTTLPNAVKHQVHSSPVNKPSASTSKKPRLGKRLYSSPPKPTLQPSSSVERIESPVEDGNPPIPSKINPPASSEVEFSPSEDYSKPRPGKQPAKAPLPPSEVEFSPSEDDSKPRPSKQPAKAPLPPSSSVAFSDSPVEPVKPLKINPPDSTDVEVVSSEDDSEPSPTKRVKRRLSRMVTSDEDEEMDSKPPQESDDEDEEAPVVLRSKRRSNGKQKAVAAESTDEEEETERKRRLGIKRGKRREVQDSEEESNHSPQEEVARDSQEDSEEEDDPMDGLDDNLVLDSRLRSAPQRNSEKATLRKHLERLKRRKLGYDTPPVQKSESESESEEEEEVDRPRGRRVVKVIPGARPTRASDSGSESEPDQGREDGRSSIATNDDDDSDQDSLDGWIENDGGTNTAIMPEGFSMRTHQSDENQFKVVMEMFVHLACLKAKERKKFRKDEQHDGHYGLSLRALRRKMDGLRDSIVTSSKWTSEFKEALNTHPTFESFHMDEAVPGCGACRISSRLSTYRGNLSGDDYDRDTFEPIPERDPSVDSDESENDSPTSFDLGRFCRARVECYHNFVHWEWQLFDRTADEVETLKMSNRRNNPTQAERPAANDPAGILNWLDRRGIVQQEWSRLVELMDAARGLDAAFRKGDEDE